MIYNTKRNEILKELKDDLFSFLTREGKNIEIFFESDFYANTKDLNEYIVIAKNAENLEKLNISCNTQQRFLSIQITYFSYNYIKNNELENENDEVVELIETFITTYRKQKINLEQIDFDFETESSKEKSFTTDFKCEIVYIK